MLRRALSALWGGCVSLPSSLRLLEDWTMVRSAPQCAQGTHCRPQPTQLSSNVTSALRPPRPAISGRFSDSLTAPCVFASWEIRIWNLNTNVFSVHLFSISTLEDQPQGLS